MYIRQYFKKENGQRTAYWALVESYRTKRGPRQRVVGWLGKLDEAGRLGVKQAIHSTDILILARLLKPFSELYIAEQWYRKTALDRGMVSEDNIKFLRDGDRRYIIGTPKATRKKFEQEILKDDWHAIRDGLEVKIVPWPKDDDDDESCTEPVAATTNANGDTPASEQEPTPETFLLCRSRDRSKKEEATTQRFETKIEEALVRMKAGCEKKNRDV